MRAVAAIVRREMGSYFVSPIAYTVIVGFLLIAGFGFRQQVQEYVTIPRMTLQLEGLTIQNTLIARLVALWMSMAILICTPTLSMRLFSEERKGGTIELLLTSPLTTVQLVLGKYLGGLCVFLLMLLCTLPYFVLLGFEGNVDWGAVAATYLALALLGAVVLAVGLLASALTENQIVAVVATYGMFLPFFVIDQLVPFVGEAVGDVLAGLSVGRSAGQMISGVIDTHDLVLHGGLIFLFLFLSVQVLDSARWR